MPQAVIAGQVMEVYTNVAAVAPWLWLTRVKLAELAQTELAWTELAWAELARTELVRTELVWMELVGLLRPHLGG